MPNTHIDDLKNTNIERIEDESMVQSDGSYDRVRFNATKHGILSRLVVLAHENHNEYDHLLEALFDEHKPNGMTERHLIEELAAIIWRKRRVLLAEGAKINEGLKAAINRPRAVVASAAPFQRGLSSENVDLRELVDATPVELSERLDDATLDMAAAQRANAILHNDAANSYEEARLALTLDSREWWDSFTDHEQYPESAEGLGQFISEKLEPLCFKMLQEAQHTPAIRAQLLGEGLQVKQLEMLNRYETHLDRKFERTLAMLLKLKDLRNV